MEISNERLKKILEESKLPEDTIELLLKQEDIEDTILSRGVTEVVNCYQILTEKYHLPSEAAVIISTNFGGDFKDYYDGLNWAARRYWDRVTKGLSPEEAARNACY